jgi:DEAD/DEAH box helicase domain-containing protein
MSPTDDPVRLLQTACLPHIPVNPSGMSKLSNSQAEHPAIPEPEVRSPVNVILKELEQQAWYKNQMVYRREFPARPGRTGKFYLSLVFGNLSLHFGP